MTVRTRGCVYCGGTTVHGQRACPAHTDLLRIERNLHAALRDQQVKQEPAERFLPEVLLDGLPTRGA